MKKIFCLLMLVLTGSACFADWNTFETNQDAYDRKSNENYQTYKNNNYQAPLGGYNRQMNDNGGREYGMNNNNTGFNSLNSDNSKNYSRNSNSWNSF